MNSLHSPPGAATNVSNIASARRTGHRGIAIQNATDRRGPIQTFLFLISLFTLHHSLFAASIQIDATATGLAPDEPLEFLLIGPDSGHDYEAFAQCQQSASEIRAAMVAAGLTPGAPANPDAFLFMPRGERLRISVTASNQNDAVPLDSLLTTTGPIPIPPFPGFVFSGSRFLTNDATTLLADVDEPYSVISIYNEAASIIDVRGTAPQQSTYGTRTLAEAARFEKGTPLTFTIEPWFQDGWHRTNVSVIATMEGFLFNPPLADDELAPNVLLQTDAPAVRPYLPDEFLSYCSTLTRLETEVFMAVSFTSNLTLHSAIRASSTIQLAVDNGWIIVDPPSTNNLFYRAFLPDPQHRERSRRLEQPWELHLATGAVPETATAIFIEETWLEDAGDSRLTPHETIVTSGTEFETTLARHDGLPVILVYASSNTTVGGIMRFLSPCLDTHSTVYVFEE